MPAPTTTPYLRAAFLAAPVAAVVSMAAAALAVLAAGGFDGGPLIQTVRTSAQVWLASLGSGISTDTVAITIVPVGTLAVAVLITAAMARWVLPDPVDELPAFVISTAGAHGVVGAVVAAAVSTGGVQIFPVRAAAAAFVVGGLGAALGAASKHGGGDALWFTISDHVRRAVRAAASGVITVLAFAAIVVVLLLLAHLDRAGDLWALLDPGTGGGVVLALGCLLAVPNLVLWTAAALIGPGFALGTGTSVDLTGSQLGAVPGFPVLAALPDPGQFPGWVFLLGLVPLAGGAVAGWRADPGKNDTLTHRLIAGLAAGAAAGFVLGVLVGASGGAIGPGRMADAGPAALTSLLVAVPTMALGGGIGAALAHYRGTRAHQSSPKSGAGTGPLGRARLWKRYQPPGSARRNKQP